ncbi:MAG: hypothetical protein CTY19_05480 [Methylomonas sp.]|nr:MAG: hypothetical protein CTY19_05480 [Methylomonas sp.]
MNQHTIMNEELLIQKAVQVLIREFGPVEAGRFLSLPHVKHQDSLKRHQDWQDDLDKEVFFDEVFGE